MYLLDEYVKITKVKAASTSTSSIIAFDWLRAIGCLMVVMWHSEVLNILNINQTLRTIRDIISFNFLLLAVPIFIQISLFLFLKKRKTARNYFFKKRLPRLVKLYIFWLTSRLLFYTFFGIPISKFFDSITSTITTVLSGANSEVYFVLSLIITTSLTELCLQWTSNTKDTSSFFSVINILFTCSGLLIVVLPIISIFLDNGDLCIWWNPINFLPYIFSSMIIFNDFDRGKITFKNSTTRFKVISLFILWILSATVEWTFLNQPDIFNFPLPQYTRISSVFASFLLVYLSLMIYRIPPRFVQNISAKSSGIYFVHKYFVNKYSIGFLQEALPTFASFVNVIIFVFGLICSLVIASLLKRIKLLRFVT